MKTLPSSSSVDVHTHTSESKLLLARSLVEERADVAESTSLRVVVVVRCTINPRAPRCRAGCDIISSGRDAFSRL